MKTIDLAIVTPTLNEENYIGKLLDSLTKQTVLPKEVVVVDAYSQDKTIKVIKKRQKLLPQLRYYQIPKSTISKQRNFGLAKTHQPHVLFLDADTFLKDADALERYYSEVLRDPPDIAAAFNLPDSDYWKDRVYFWVMNTIIRVMKPIWPMASGINIYVKREVFEQLGGFNEQIRVGEDFELVQRLVRSGKKFKLLKDSNVHTSVRRFATEGRIKFSFKMSVAFIQLLRGGYQEINVEYPFGHFGTEKSSQKKA